LESMYSGVVSLRGLRIVTFLFWAQWSWPLGYRYR
jgi:hypothetical protein